jgi:hypothetical protein
MLVQRRSFLTGLGSLFLSPAIVKASSLMPLRGVVMLPAMTIPSWCPPGWAPANGHLVDRFQFPELHAWYQRTRQFEAIKGSQFHLPGNKEVFDWYNGYQELTLDDPHYHNRPDYSDRLNRAANPCVETVEVPLIAVQPMRRANGTVAQPWMQANFVVNAEVIRASYAEPSLTPDKQVFRDQWKFVRKGTADSSDLVLAQ